MILTCAERSELVLKADMLDRARIELDKVEGRMPEALREVGIDVFSEQARTRRAKLIEKLGHLASKNGSPWINERKLYHHIHRYYDRSATYKEDLQDSVYAKMIERRQFQNRGGTLSTEYRIRAQKGKFLKGAGDT